MAFAGPIMSGFAPRRFRGLMFLAAAAVVGLIALKLLVGGGTPATLNFRGRQYQRVANCPRRFSSSFVTIQSSGLPSGDHLRVPKRALRYTLTVLYLVRPNGTCAAVYALEGGP